MKTQKKKTNSTHKSRIRVRQSDTSGELSKAAYRQSKRSHVRCRQDKGTDVSRRRDVDTTRPRKTKRRRRRIVSGLLTPGEGERDVVYRAVR